MANFSDYIDWRGDITFYMSQENKVDFLILSQLSYLNFDNLIPSGDFSFKISLQELNEIFKFSPDFESRKNLGTLINPMTVDLFSKVAESERFKSVKVTGYEAITDLSIEKQFAAMTFILPDGTNYVSFRTMKSDDQDGGNALFAALEYWNGGFVYNGKRNAVAMLKKYQQKFHNANHDGE